MNKLIIDNMDRMKQYIDTISVSKNSYTKKSKKKKNINFYFKGFTRYTKKGRIRNNTIWN